MNTSVNFRDINNLQETIMLIIGSWARVEKTPIPQKEIIAKMEVEGVGRPTVVNALNSLLRKGFLRRTSSIQKNKTAYVQLRGV